MLNFFKALGKEVLFFIALIIGSCVSIITDSIGIGFLALTLLVIGGVFFNRYYSQVRAAKDN